MHCLPRNLTLSEIIDVLDELCEEENNDGFTSGVRALYLEPPDNDDDLSGEDDASGCEGGIPDNVCRAQLKSNCELVLEDGRRIVTTRDLESGSELENAEKIFEDILSVQQLFVDPQTSVELTPVDKAFQPMEPQRKRLCFVIPNISESPLPALNKHTTFVWQKDRTSASIPVFPEANYTDCIHLKAHQQFEKFFDDTLLQHICDCSALYANYHNRPDPKVSVGELRVVIAILIVTGYAGANSHRHMWSNDSDLKNEMVLKSMRRNRFEEILRNLHFEPNICKPKTTVDKFWKLRSMTDHLKAKMLKHFHPEQNLSYDESMIGYFGRHGCKQFIKSKPLRFGYKVWSLCTPSGYLVNFDIYQGKNPLSNTKYEERFGKCAAPLVNMIDDFSLDIQRLPFSFFFDNLFTGLPLLAYLKLRGYNGTGTIRENRIPSSCPLPDKKIMMKRKRGDMETIKMKSTNIRLTKWCDNSVVCMASSAFGADPVSNACRYSRDAHKKISVTRPYVVAEYNKYMCGVDRLDQNISYYRIGYRGKKWWSCIFTWLVDACIVNAWLLQRVSKSSMSQLEFRREIALFYCKHYGSYPNSFGRISDRNVAKTTLRFDQKEHFVILTENRRRCAGELCKSIVRSACEKCDVGLCLRCFKSFHTETIK